jgi:hypothetical protein
MRWPITVCKPTVGLPCLVPACSPIAAFPDQYGIGMTDLSALAGILPHDGKNIKFSDITDTVRTTFNFSQSFATFVPVYAARVLNKDYNKDTLSLHELDIHNGIEHDASLTRSCCLFGWMGGSLLYLCSFVGDDTALVKDQSKPHLPYVMELLDSASGKDKEGNVILTPEDLSAYSAKRRVDAKETNPDFSLTLSQKVFGSAK